MSCNITRGLKTSARTLIQYIGAPFSEIETVNGSDGATWSAMTNRICTTVESADSRITVANIQASKAHPSSKDKDDKQHVITVGLQTNAGTRIGSLHVHLDGTFKFFASRAGKLGGYEANIARAQIPGHIPSGEDA